LIVVAALSALSALCGEAQPLADKTTARSLGPDVTAKIATIAQQTLRSMGVPSASISIVRDSKIAYTGAFGMARIEPPLPATPQMRYPVGSISKQFTAAAVLLLQQDGKLKLDDPISKYLPELTHGDKVTIRMILSHTSGYQDYWPQDYVMPPMLKPVTPQYIIDTWATKPLDFDPGTKWQYSNTNYVIAGRIVERVSGEPLFQFLQSHIFTPLKMTSVYNSDEAKPGNSDPEGYMRYALGPPRPAPRTGNGWIFAAGELAMTADDLARWTISLMNQSLLSPESYKEMFTSVKLKNGTDTHYGLGIMNFQHRGHQALFHNGEVSGFVADEIVFPVDHSAIIVLTNEDASTAATAISKAIDPLILETAPAETDHAADLALQQAKSIFSDLQQGRIDRSLFTENCNAYFSQQALEDFRTSLKPLGSPASFAESDNELRGGMTFRSFSLSFSNPDSKLVVTTYTLPDGKLEQYLVLPTQ
jgi:CubicO group peptidase (beta-lactamase class C family)